jgi:hypothetical protein
VVRRCRARRDAAFDAGRREHVRHPGPPIAPLMPYLAMFLLILLAGLLATCFF